MGTCVTCFEGHTEDVLDITFNATGNKLATASADSTAKVYSVTDEKCLLTLEGIFLLISGH
jgi:dynein assembly factor with WDR repeat domains 1